MKWVVPLQYINFNVGWESKIMLELEVGHLVYGYKDITVDMHG